MTGDNWNKVIFIIEYVVNLPLFYCIAKRRDRWAHLYVFLIWKHTIRPIVSYFFPWNKWCSFFIALKIGLTMHCLYSLAEPVAWKNAWWPILFVIVLKKAWCTWCNKILTNCSKFKDFNLDSPSTLMTC